jgi:ABC-type bacteriocin/lantibiotic exporter with double-glycine peptidase domain
MPFASRGAAALPVVALLAGCAYTGSSRGFDPAGFDRDPGWIAVRGAEPILQEADSDCGAAALAMVLRHWGLGTTRRDVFEACGSPAGGIRAADLREYARKQGLKAFVFEGKFEDFEKELSKRRPVIVGTVKPHATFVLTHYEVVTGLHPGKKLVVTLDPAEGWRQNTWDGFMEEWRLARCVTLVVFRSEGDSK